MNSYISSKNFNKNCFDIADKLVVESIDSYYEIVLNLTKD